MPTCEHQRVMAALKLQFSEIRALVALLPHDQQAEWLRIHKENCARMRIDPLTGESVSVPSADESAEAADLSA